MHRDRTHPPGLKPGHAQQRSLAAAFVVMLLGFVLGGCSDDAPPPAREGQGAAPAGSTTPNSNTAPPDRARTSRAALLRDARRLHRLAADGKSAAVQRTALSAMLRKRRVPQASIDVVLEHTVDGVVLEHTRERVFSRIGGGGLLPEGTPWPRDIHGAAMTPIATLDLAELRARPPLPRTGTLLLFYTFDESLDGTGVKAIYARPGTKLRRVPPPADSYPFGVVRVRGLHRPITGEVDQVADALSARAGWDHLSDTLDGLVGDFHGAHYLLGASSDVQGSFLNDVPRFLRAAPSRVRERYTAAELKGRGWTLLAEFTYEPRLRNFEFADGGSLYYVIPTRDLAASRFDRVIGSIQSA